MEIAVELKICMEIIQKKSSEYGGYRSLLGVLLVCDRLLLFTYDIGENWNIKRPFSNR